LSNVFEVRRANEDPGFRRERTLDLILLMNRNCVSARPSLSDYFKDSCKCRKGFAMKNFFMACLVIILIGTCAPIWARGGSSGHGGGSFHGGGFSVHHGGWGGGFHHGGWGHGGYYGGLGMFGLGYGMGYYGGFPYGGYGGYYNYPSTIVTVPVTPPVYIQQTPPANQQYQSGYWYYCTNPEGYYPYIRECLTRWQQVAPRPSVPQ
jgi:hypothetical protein